jgi:hypothetical protein
MKSGSINLNPLRKRMFPSSKTIFINATGNIGLAINESNISSEKPVNRVSSSPLLTTKIDPVKFWMPL